MESSESEVALGETDILMAEAEAKGAKQSGWWLKRLKQTARRDVGLCEMDVAKGEAEVVTKKLRIYLLAFC